MKVIFRFFLSFFFILISAEFSHSISISLDGAVRTAMENNEDIHAASFTIESAKEFMREINTMNHPTFSAQLHYVVNDLRFYNNNGLIRNDTGFNFGASVEGNYVLYSFGLIKKSMEAAAISKETAVADKEKELTELVFRVKIAYYGALVASENYSIISRGSGEVEKMKATAYKNKRIAKKDISNIEAVAADMQARATTALALKNSAFRLLSILCGTYEPITELLTFFDLELLPEFIDGRKLSDHIENSPAVRVLQKSVELGLKNAQKEEALNNASLNLFGKYGFSDQSPRPILNDPLWIGGGYAGFALTIPIYDGGKARSKGRQERLNAYIKMSRLEQTKRYVDGELADAVEKFDAYKEITAANKQAESFYMQTYDEYFQEFIGGQASAFETCEILYKYINAKLKTVESVNIIYSNIATVEKITGQSL